MATHSFSSSSATLRRVLRLLETLGSTSSGSTIYHHIERCFFELESTQLESETQYIELLELLLDALTQSLGQDSPLYTSGHILRTTLIPPLLPHELRRLKTDAKQLIAQLQQQDGFEPSSLHHSLIPRSGQTAATVTTGYNLERQNRNSTTAPGQFDQSLQKTRSNLQSIKGKLDRQIEQAVAYNNELAHLIKASMEAIRVVDAKQDVDEMRITHLQHYIKLFKQHQDLTTKFSTIQQQLNAFENESQQLDDELTRVHMLSVTDELTQLPNRRAFIQRLDNEMARVQRYGSPLALAIIDLDEFKPINDTFGHNAGDQVLRYFAETALTVLRHHDTVARYGGEEFAVLMPNTEIEGALCTLKKIQSEVAGSLCRLDDGVKITAPTFSAGVALYNPGESPEELIKRADTAMYRAKHSGRNCIEVHTMGTKQKLQVT